MTDIRNFGGNLISKPDLGDGLHTFATGPYTYQHLALHAGQEHTVELASCVVYVRKLDGQGLTVNGKEIAAGDSALLELNDAVLALESGTASILITGTENPAFENPRFDIVRAAEQYKVTKPWGYELWVNGEHPAYVLKEIFLKAGSRTSLQYHNFKKETNVVFEGTAQIVYKANEDVDNMDVLEADLGTVDLPAGSVMDIEAPTLHRVVAVSDVLLCESSTPHLDDVVRVQDDSGRGQGRIQNEHKAA